MTNLVADKHGEAPAEVIDNTTNPALVPYAGDGKFLPTEADMLVIDRDTELSRGDLVFTMYKSSGNKFYVNKTRHGGIAERVLGKE